MAAEKRTRSQLTLPDDILQIPSRSPLKDARTTLRNTTAKMNGNGLSGNAEESEDELLLSPTRKDASPSKPTKRSASPPLQNEYSTRSGSPSEGRELKRLKRDLLDLDGYTNNRENLLAVHKFRQRLTSGHARNNSEPNIRHLNRQRSATPGRKPASTVGASPPRINFSPAPSPARKDRAQSVPLFTSNHEIPHIDFRHRPLSPKRKSRSRSPAKDRASKLHMTAVGIVPSVSLSTVLDELTTDNMDVDDPGRPNEDILLRLEISTVTKSNNLVADAVPDATDPIHIDVPQTPAITTFSDNLISMSPLTPVPETPFPSRTPADGDAEDCYTSESRQGNISKESSQTIKVGPTNFQSSIPRFTSRPAPFATATAGPSSRPPKGKKSDTSNEVSTSKPAPLDAFVILMNSSKNTKKNKMKKKEKEKVKKVPQYIISLEEEDDEEHPEVHSYDAQYFAHLGVASGASDGSTATDPSPTAGALAIEDTSKLANANDDMMMVEPKSSENKEANTSSTDVALTTEETSDLANANDNTMTVDQKSSESKEADTFPTGGALTVEEASELTNINDDTMVELNSTEQENVTPVEAVTEEPLIHEDEKEEPHHAEDNHVDDFLQESNDNSVVDQLSPAKSSGRKSKLPPMKKRQPISVPPPSRVTRSVSNKKNKDEAENLNITPSKQPISVVPTEGDTVEMTVILPPINVGSPAKKSTPKKDSSLSKTPIKSKIPTRTPSPSKIARSSILLSSKPSTSALGRAFSSVSSHSVIGTSSSLSTLSNALEQLRMPAPSRPNTSMGFNREMPKDNNEQESLARSKDDGALGRASLGVVRREGSLKRSATMGAASFKAPSENATASSSKSIASLALNGKNMVQRPLSSFMTKRGAFMAGTGRGRPLFGVRDLRRTVSKKTPLPMVVGSPVKGGDDADQTMLEGDSTMNEDEEVHVYEKDGSGIIIADNDDGSTFFLEELSGNSSGKAKEKESFSVKSSNASRRVSMLSQSLSQSLSAVPSLPPADNIGLMGPPPTPPHAKGRTTSSTYPSTSTASSPPRPAPAVGTRASARIAKIAPPVTSKSDGQGSSGRKGTADKAAQAESLKILDDFVIFVDVRTDDGDEAGTLFAQMLESVGARVLTRVGQTCTHIVFKNGLMSTITRYRLLRDPKPLVVGIAWVVECVEQRKRVDETDFLVDIETANIAGVNKRRRSMIPKLFPAPDFEYPSIQNSIDLDRSVDGSTSMTKDDDLPPLERARRRKSILTGPS